MRAPTLERADEERGSSSAEANRRGGRSRAERALLAAQAGSLLVMTGTVATRLWQDRPWVGFVIVAVTLVCWAPEVRKARARRWWFAYVAGTFVYTLLRSYADETSIPVRTMYVIHLDKALFLGGEPVVWLQERLFSRDHVSALDVFAVQVHWSFFVAPHAAAIAIFLWRRDQFPRYTVLMVSTLYVGLLLFFLVPTTPPWLASQAGDLPSVFRVMDFVGGEVNGDTYRSFSSALGEPNSVAAMPSIHMAVTFALFLWAMEHHRRLAPLLLVYALVMAFSLMYLAEHYAADLLAGVIVAVICYSGTKRLMPLPVRN